MNYFLTLGSALFLYMNVWFVVSLILRRNDVADIAWGLGFVLISWFAVLVTGTYAVQSLLVAVLVTIWGLRLSWHIFVRNRKKAEDYRYQQWRMDWGRWFYVRSYVQVYLLQGLLLFVIVSPVLLIHREPTTALSLFAYVGVAVWLVGFLFESVGDWQLAQFLKDPTQRGKLMTTGLWKYTRHPNYFGEVTQWWGLWIVALSVPYGVYGLIGPLTITLLIWKVSGVLLLEKKMSEHPDFAEYKRKTSVLFPLPPKS